MTEEEWQAANSIEPLMSAAFQHTSVRKVMCFACACCRAAYPDSMPESVRKALEANERYRDGQVSRSTWRRAYQQVASIRTEIALRYGHTRLGWDWYAIQATCELFADSGYLTIPRHLIAGQIQLTLGGGLEGNFCSFVRDIFGNPFRPVAFDAAWRTSAAVAVASQMYDSRDFAAMPILADALQDAGCENTDILNHCRGPGPHVRGCWVVDHVLGKA